MSLLWKNQKRVKLTRKMVEDAKPHSTIFTGQGYIEHPWFNDAKTNLEEDGRSVLVNFVVYRGGVADWCIYHSLDANLEPARYLDGNTHLDRTFRDVAENGAKPHREEIIRALVDCDDDTFSRYRH